MYRKAFINLFIVIVFFSACASKDTKIIVEEQKKSQAEILIDNSPIKKYYNEMIENFNILTALSKFKDKESQLKYEVLSKFINKYFSYENIKPKLVEIYSQNFTESELIELNRFNNEDSGKRYMENLPKIISEMTKNFTKIVESKKEILAQMIKKRDNEIKDNQKELANILSKNMSRDFIFKPNKTIIKEKNQTPIDIMLNNPIYEDLYYISIKNSMNNQLKKNPELILYKDIFEKFIINYVSYNDLKPYFSNVINKYFTKDEIEKINSFENTEIGKKYNKIFPKIQEDIKNMFQNILLQHKDEFKKIIEEKSKNKEE
ncbi:hypothetical protein CRU92_00530 [Arcobacter sp. FW59]|nr:hypothetical protein CRU92_00530 [Arcobacter sp. FW59]